MNRPDKDALPLYGCITGITLSSSPVELAPGIAFESGYFHVFSAPMLAFKEAAAGLPTPGPWVPVDSGSNSRHSHVQLAITDIGAMDGLSPSQVAWHIAALLRLRAESPVRIVVVANQPLASLSDCTDSWALAFEPPGHQTGLFRTSHTELTTIDIAWLSRALIVATRLWNDERFMRAFTMFDQSLWTGRAQMGKVFIWTALEILFDISGEQHKTKAMCGALSDFVSISRQDRDNAYNVARDLYEKRGRVLHGGRDVEDQDYAQTFLFARAALTKVLDSGELPPSRARVLQ
jgi:hypothetical protein